MSELAATVPPPLAETLVRSAGAPSVIGPLSLAEVADAQRYDFERVLGLGGMGEVRLCVDRRIGREVAFKIAHRRDQQAPADRFVREALLQARLEHPAFAPVYDVGTDPDGQLYFTMRRIRGETLHAIVASATGATLLAGSFFLSRLLDRLAALELQVHAQAWVLHRVIAG
jgi:serine/threonine protein kinase